jgi:hypothetical protein
VFYPGTDNLVAAAACFNAHGSLGRLFPQYMGGAEQAGLIFLVPDVKPNHEITRTSQPGRDTLGVLS